VSDLRGRVDQYGHLLRYRAPLSRLLGCAAVAGQRPEQRVRQRRRVARVATSAHRAQPTTKNREFVSQHDNLERLELARAQPQRRHRKRTPKKQVQQRHDQQTASLRPSPKRPTLRPRRSSEALFSHRMDLRTQQPVGVRGARLKPDACREAGRGAENSICQVSCRATQRPVPIPSRGPEIACRGVVEAFAAVDDLANRRRTFGRTVAAAAIVAPTASASTPVRDSITTRAEMGFEARLDRPPAPDTTTNQGRAWRGVVTNVGTRGRRARGDDRQATRRCRAS
jgi:hypothetical protein